MYKRTLKPLEIPDIWYSGGKKFMTQERGSESYVIRRLDDPFWQYMVMKKIVENTASGLMECLQGQEHELFRTMEEAVQHFYKHEEGKTSLMLVV